MTKISNFSQVLTFEQTDLINIVRNSTNYTVPFSSYASALGVTGTLNSISSASGIPILEQPSTAVNNIRAIEATNGIIAALSAQNGISLKQNFTYNKTGEALIVDENAASPIFKSLVAGAGMSLTTSGSTIVLTVATLADSVNVVNKFNRSTAFVGLTIASGVVTATASAHQIGPESGSADDLDTISGGVQGDRLTLISTSSSNTITIKHGTGNIVLDATADKVLDNSSDVIELMFYNTTWRQVSFSSNGT